VRDLENEAVHEETSPTRKELEDLRGITEMVLRYLFTLPNMSKKRRGEKLPWEPQAPASRVSQSTISRLTVTATAAT